MSIERGHLQLEGRAAVVVGAGSPIGRSCAIAFAREGAEVLAVDPDEATAASVCREIVSGGGVANPMTADLASEADSEAVARRCESSWKRLDVLFQCPAMLDYESPPATIGQWERIIRTNLLGPVIYTNALFDLLARSGEGSIIYLTSIDGLYGNPRFPAYSVSKAGLIALTHVMAHDGAPHNIRVNAIAMAALLPIGPSDPQPVRIPDAARAAVHAATPIKRPATPDDIAAAALFFASSASGYVTGVVLPVDGGRTAITPGTGTLPGSGDDSPSA